MMYHPCHSQMSKFHQKLSPMILLLEDSKHPPVFGHLMLHVYLMSRLPPLQSIHRVSEEDVFLRLHLPLTKCASLI